MKARVSVLYMGLLAATCMFAPSAGTALAEVPPAEMPPTDAAGCDGRWQQVSAPSGGSKSRLLYDVVALSASDAWAVGSESELDPYYPQALAMHWDGSAWTVVPTPMPAGARSGVLRSVTAVSPTNVVAVGEYENGAGAYPVLAMRWNGTKWKLMSTGILGTDAQAYGVDAVSRSDIWMVGQKGAHSSPFNAKTFTARWDGSTWSSVSSPNKPDSVQNWLQDVSAASADDVWAIGVYTNTQTANGTTQHWDGSSWKIVKAAAPAFQLNGVVALKPSVAWSVGRTFGSEFEIERWNGDKWRSKSDDVSGDSIANGIAAAGRNDVWAVGVISESGQTPLMQHWNGSGWTRVDSDKPTSTSLTVEDVDVLANGERAYAVGAFIDPGDPYRWRPLVLRWC